MFTDFVSFHFQVFDCSCVTLTSSISSHCTSCSIVIVVHFLTWFNVVHLSSVIKRENIRMEPPAYIYLGQSNVWNGSSMENRMRFDILLLTFGSFFDLVFFRFRSPFLDTFDAVSVCTETCKNCQRKSPPP